MDFVLKLLFVGLFLGALYSAFRPRFVFVVRIENGVARVTKGTVPRLFLEEVNAICRHNQITRGSLKGVAKGRRILLTFSGPISQACQQRFRNAWCLHG